MNNILSIFSDPRTFIVDLLLRLPAILLGLTLHEAAHGFASYKLGDPTAKMLGRLSVNPLRHLDPIGTAMLVLVGFGWAKPVPINPRYYKHPRRDDLIVSLAGVTTNLILCILSSVILYSILSRLISQYSALDQVFFPTKEAFTLAPFLGETLILPEMGATLGYLYQIFANIATINLVLAVFNLLPIPPLDGYHVLNDLILNKPAFASPMAMRIGQMVLFALLLSGVIGKVLTFVITGAFSLLGNGAYWLFGALGLL